MADKSLIRIAYQTLQQGRSIAGLAHKQLSTKLMEMLVPAAMPEVDPTSPDLLNELRHSMASLEKLDWEEAEQGIYPKSQLLILHGLTGRLDIHSFGLTCHQHGQGEKIERLETYLRTLMRRYILIITYKIFIIKQMVTSVIILHNFMISKLKFYLMEQLTLCEEEYWHH